MCEKETIERERKDLFELLREKNTTIENVLRYAKRALFQHFQSNFLQSHSLTVAKEKNRQE